MQKCSSFYKYGMQPAVFSYLEYKHLKKKWARGGINVSFAPNNILKVRRESLLSGLGGAGGRLHTHTHAPCFVNCRSCIAPS